MGRVSFIYFDGCPNAPRVKGVLDQLNTSYETFEQKSLSENHPFLFYSSPSVLIDGTTIIGSKLESPGGACSLEELSTDEIITVLKYSLSATGDSYLLTLEKILRALVLKGGTKKQFRVHMENSELWVRTVKPGCSYLSPDVIAHVSEEELRTAGISELFLKLRKKIKKHVHNRVPPDQSGPDQC